MRIERPLMRMMAEIEGYKVWDPHYKRKGDYEEKMKAATWRRLEEYFEPHNRRPYDFIGTDFGW
jgi:hypothetical protein